MTKLNEIYKCNVCGNITEMLHTGSGSLVCCNQNMQNIEAGTSDASIEKHVPTIENNAGTYNIAVGSIAHPMTSDHHIEWIELSDGDNTIYRKNLKVGEEPKISFNYEGKNVKARTYCNLHGLWEKD